MLSRILFNWPYKIAALSIAIALHFYVSHINDPAYRQIGEHPGHLEIHPGEVCKSPTRRRT